MIYIVKNKKKIAIVLIVLSFLLVGFSIINSTYALFYNEKVAANPNKYSTGLLSIEAVSKSDTISLDNVLPIEDDEGIETDAYVFTIRNNGNLDYTFDVKLLSTSDNTISPEYIKLKIDDNEVTTLSNLTNSIIKSNLTLKAKESIDISIRTWLAINTPNTEIGKTFTSNLVIDGQAIYTETNNLSYDGAAGEIYDLFTSNSHVTNNSITYEVDTNHNLIQDVEDNIRYYGANPNNYIKFNCDVYPDTNCETWRIIGVIDGKLKLIRNESIGSYSYDSSASSVNSGRGINQWGESIYTTNNNRYLGADLMRLLNPGYESQSINNSLYYNSRSGSCYNKGQNSSVTCDFTNTGIKNDATRNKIAEVTYYIGGYSTQSPTVSATLTFEKGSLTGTGVDNVLRTTIWSGRVAVPYPSDYAYAVDLSLCSNKTLNGYKDDSVCASNNWMKNIITNNGSNGGWFLNPYTSNSITTFYLRSTGYTGYGGYEYSCEARSVVPTLYLIRNTNITDGDGTEDNPYRLS